VSIRQSARPRPVGPSAFSPAGRRPARWLLVGLFAVGLAAATGLLLRDTPGHSEPPGYRFAQARVEGGSASEPLLSGDGKVLLYRQDGQIWTQPVAGGRKSLVSAGIDGAPGDQPAFVGAVSPNGRFVVFDSYAANLVSAGAPPIDPNIMGLPDLPTGPYPLGVYVRDTAAGTTVRISPLDHPQFGRLWLSGGARFRVPATFIDDHRLVIPLGSIRAPLATESDPIPWMQFLAKSGGYVVLDVGSRAISPIELPAALGCGTPTAPTSIGSCPLVLTTSQPGWLTVLPANATRRIAYRPADGAVITDPFLSRNGLWDGRLNASCQLTLVERASGTTTVVGLLPNGQLPIREDDVCTETQPGGGVAVSDDGRFVAFIADPDAAASGRSSVFLRDVTAEQTYLISQIKSGDYVSCPPGSMASDIYVNRSVRNLQITPGGNAVVFESCASNLLASAALGRPGDGGFYDASQWTTYIVQVAPFAQLTHRRVAVGITRE
jgi:hypothetical protein